MTSRCDIVESVAGRSAYLDGLLHFSIAVV